MEFQIPDEVDCCSSRDEEGEEECVSSGIDEEINFGSEQDCYYSDAPEFNRIFFTKTVGKDTGTVSGKAAAKEKNCSRRGGDSLGRFGIRVSEAGESEAPVKRKAAKEEEEGFEEEQNSRERRKAPVKRKAVKEEGFKEEQNSTERPRTYRDGGHNKMSKKRIRQNVGKGAQPFLNKILQSDPLDFRWFLAAPSMGSSGSSIRNLELEMGAFRKWQNGGEDLEGNERCQTDEFPKIAVESCAPLHTQQLGEQSDGHAKYRKEWTSILQAVQQRFGKCLTKKECQSKYRCVSRECADSRYNTSFKFHQRDLSRNPSVARRELLEPKFCDVRRKIAGKVRVLKPSCGTRDSRREEERLINGQGVQNPPKMDLTLRCLGMEEMSSEHQMQDCTSSIRGMQQLVHTQLQASEKREEAMKYRTEFMMELLTQHMEHVEKRVSNVERSQQQQQPQHDLLLERINKKLEKVLDGFTTLNNHLSALTSQISKTKTLETHSSG